MNNVVDSSAWLEYFANGQNAQYFAAPIEDIAHLVVPTITLYEVFKKVMVEKTEDLALRAIAQMKLGKVVEIDENIALSAAQYSIKHKLPMADSLIFATAKANKATLWTQDQHFRDLEGVNYRFSE